MTVDEFVLAQRHYPIVFSIGDNPMPIALMGLNEGINIFLDEKAVRVDTQRLHPGLYPPLSVHAGAAQPDSDELSLCFDPTSGAVGDSRKASRCSTATSRARRPRQSSSSASSSSSRPAHQRVHGRAEGASLLMDGEVAIQPEGAEQPFIYRGFQMVDEEKFRDLRGDELRKMNQNGMLPLILAHSSRCA